MTDLVNEEAVEAAETNADSEEKTKKTILQSMCETHGIRGPNGLTSAIVADMFKAEYSGRLIYEAEADRWSFWSYDEVVEDDGGDDESAEGWVQDPGTILHGIRLMVEHLAADQGAKAARALRSSFYEDVLKTLGRDPDIRRKRLVDWDLAPGLVGLPGMRVWDMTSEGEDPVRLQRPEDLITRQTGVMPVEPNDEQQKFVLDYFGSLMRRRRDPSKEYTKAMRAEDKARRDYALALVGYLATNHTAKKIVPLMRGEGNNGKSLLVNLMERMFGEEETGYAGSVPRKAITGQQAHDEVYSVFMHSRMAVVSEAPGAWDVDLIKRVSGGDKITTRAVHGKKRLNFRSPSKMVLVFNGDPCVEKWDKATRNRIKVLEFEQEFELDEEFAAKVLRHAPYVLWMALEAAEDFIEGRIEEPSSVRRAGTSLVKRADIIETFIEECCDVPCGDEDEDREFLVKSSDLCGAFFRWCEEGHIKTSTNATSFKKRFLSNGREHDYTTKRKNGGVYFLGVRLKPGKKRQIRGVTDYS